MKCGVKIVKFEIRILGDSLILYTYIEFILFLRLLIVGETLRDPKIYLWFLIISFWRNFKQALP